MTAHDSWAKVYDRAYKESFGSFYKEFTELTLKVIQEETAQGLKVIDFGAGISKSKQAQLFNLDFIKKPRELR